MNASAAAVDGEIVATPTIGRKRLAGYAAMSLAVIGVIAYGYHWMTVGRFIEDTDDAYVGGDITVIAPKVAGFVL